MAADMSKTMRFVGAALALSIFVASPAATQMAPVPDDDGTRRVRAHAQSLSASDLSLLERAFDAADRKQWDVAREYAARITNPAARDLVLWRAFTTKDNGGAYADMERFLASHRDWPNQRALQARTEESMPAVAMQPDQVIAWFQGREPVSGEGMIKLGDAYLRKGQDSNAKNWIRKGWIEGNFSLERMGSISSRLSRIVERRRSRRARLALGVGRRVRPSERNDELDRRRCQRADLRPHQTAPSRTRRRRRLLPRALEFGKRSRPVVRSRPLAQKARSRCRSAPASHPCRASANRSAARRRRLVD